MAAPAFLLQLHKGVSRRSEDGEARMLQRLEVHDRQQCGASESTHSGTAVGLLVII